MDFYKIVISEKKDGTLHIRPDWKVGRSTDLMTRGGSFYAIWDEAKKLWSTDIYDVQRLVDEDLDRYKTYKEAQDGLIYVVDHMESNATKLWDEFTRYIRNSGDNSHPLDASLVFADTDVRKEDYASKRLPYALRDGDFSAWDSIVGTLYNEEERAKIEWGIGSIVSGDSKFIQKFLVFYGPPASGKSTILNIVERLFPGYTAVFDARELAGNNNSFATAAFKTNPLVAIQHDGDLSRIYDNTKLNSIVAHEILPVNEKYRAVVEMRSNAFLLMGTNVPVKITDAKSGIIRRLIDVVPTQQMIEHDLYHRLMDRVNTELGAIAKHCLDRYISMGKNFYSSYRPTEMMLQTDVFYNFVESYFDVFKHEDGVSLKRAWTLYKEYCADTGIDKMLPQYKLREELKNYFFIFEERTTVNGHLVRSYYRGFKNLSAPIPTPEFPIKPEGDYSIQLGNYQSVFDELYSGQPAQYAKEDDGKPEKMWANVTTVLSDLDTSKLHYVLVPESHIVIDFDLTDEEGKKSLSRNLEEASKWPATYTETSKSGEGIHLHYTYSGDVSTLASQYADGIEIKTLLGHASLRRRLTRCNSVNITPLDSGLPKKEKPLISTKTIQSERGLRELIERNLRKEIHPGTKPSVDFIKKILDDAYSDGMVYDVRDMRSSILTFAARSTNQADQCIKTAMGMQFVSKEEAPTITKEDAPIVFFDVEVYPNLFVVCWKAQGSENVVRMINPTPEEIEPLFAQRLVGFNNRRYDNHILYARYMGFSNEDLYSLSQKMVVGNDRNVMFGDAYDISYADIYDFSSVKTSLKKFQIMLGIFHMELDLPWDKPVPEDRWKQVADYCVNDVVSTEKVFEFRSDDFTARKILAELSGLSVNHTTQQHTAKIIFGDEKNPQASFVYTDLAEEFPGYTYGPVKNEETGVEIWASSYMGENPSEGGYVYAEPGCYEQVAELDVESMHPTSIVELNLFGKYTENFKALLDARLAIKNKDYDSASKMLDGRLFQFLVNEKEEYDIESADALGYALKIVINIVYGLTSAKFPNPFRDNRNKDNIVAKRGALFMIELKNALVQEYDFQVVHIKTDSIKIPYATPEVVHFVKEFGKKYGYNFKLEATYDKFCLVNDAVYIALDGQEWKAVGAQFQHPVVFKRLFSHEEITFSDHCETKSVTQGTMYLDFSGTGGIENMAHVGKTGSFVPVSEGGGDLWRIKDGQKYAVTGTKGFKWIDRDMAIDRDERNELRIDMSYFDEMCEKAKEAVEKFTHEPFESFVA